MAFIFYKRFLKKRFDNVDEMKILKSLGPAAPVPNDCLTYELSLVPCYLISGSFADRLGINSYTKPAYARLNVLFDLATDTGPEGIEVSNFHVIPLQHYTGNNETKLIGVYYCRNLLTAPLSVARSGGSFHRKYLAPT